MLFSDDDEYIILAILSLFFASWDAVCNFFSLDVYEEGKYFEEVMHEVNTNLPKESNEWFPYFDIFFRPIGKNGINVPLVMNRDKHASRFLVE